MALELKQQVKLSQQLVMTPQLQQAIKLLQLSRHMGGRERYAPAQVLRVTGEDGNWQVDEIYLDTGEALSASSVGAARDGRLLIGAIRGDRFLDCHVF